MKKKTLIIVFLLAVLAAYFGYNYIYQDHRDISKETADFNVNAKDFISEFKSNPEDSQEKYLNKTVIVKGEITAQTNTTITLNNAVFCSFLTTANPIQENRAVSLKGRCIGYDDLLEEIKLDQCSLLTN